MSRKGKTVTTQFDTEVDLPSETDEVDTVGSDTDGTEAALDPSKAKGEKAKKEPARGELPAGYVTPVGLAKAITDLGIHKNREGDVAELKPQMVYSYMKNAPKDDPFPIETVQDSLGKDRQALKVDEGVAWWERKIARAAERKANGAKKAAAKAEKANKAEAGEDVVEAGESNVEVVEAE